ncbi:MAG: DUF4230 domain-containing protein [Solobacterium sp.]|nr:DUF4230 domain-containing protein [Solobacterium sp.]
MGQSDRNLSIETNAKLVENETTKKQNEAAARIEQKQKEASEKAASAGLSARLDDLSRKAKEQQKRADQAEESLKSEREASAKREALLKEGLSLANTALKKNKRGGFGSFLTGLVLGLMAGAAAVYFLVMPKLAPQPITVTPAPVEDANVTVDDDGILGYTAADFQEAILGGASEHQELVVMEQPLSISTTITRAGLGKLPIFSKMKDVTYYGTGVYTVDLSGMKADAVLVDENQNTVLILIPHAKLQYVNADLNKTEFEDTEHGILAFGDIKLTPEETSLLENTVYTSMEERLSEQELLDEADRFAKLKTWEIFQPLVTAISPAYKVVIELQG